MELLHYLFIFGSFVPYSVFIFHVGVSKGDFLCVCKTNEDPMKSEIILKNNFSPPSPPLVLSTPLSQRDVTGSPKWQPWRSYGIDLHSSACSTVTYSLLTGRLVDSSSISGWCSSLVHPPLTRALNCQFCLLPLLWFSFIVISDLYAGSINLLFQIKIRYVVLLRK